MGITRKNITDLEAVGQEVTDLERQLEDARKRRAAIMVKCYVEGWTWDEIVSAGQTSIGSVRKAISEAGVLRPSKGRTPVGRAKKIAARVGESV